VLWRTHTDRRSEFVGKFFGQIIDNTIDHKEATMGNRTATGGDLPTSEPRSGVHDFDFLIGKWRIRHRRLKERLAGSDEWQEFDGISEAWPILEGAGNMDDNVLELPDGAYRAISVRTFDPPVVGSVVNGIGTLMADDTFNQQPIVMRFVWSNITENSCRWEQAFSLDGGRNLGTELDH